MYHKLSSCGCSTLSALPDNESRWAFSDGQLSTPLMGGQPTTRYALLASQQTLKLASYGNLPWANATQTDGVEFPFQIREPYWTSNLWWWNGQAIVNAGAPRFRNDPNEYLRSAMVESDWDAVGKWLSWRIAVILKRGGSTANVADELALFPFGSFKYTGGAFAKKFYPFSMADYQTFFETFKKYESGADADKACLDAAFSNYKQLYATAIKSFNGSVPMALSLTPCKAKLGWWHGIINTVGLIAAFVGAAYAGSLLAASGGGTAGAASGVAAESAVGAATGAAGAAELGTVAVTASALPTIPTAIGAGSIAAATGTLTANAPLETVQVTATRATPSVLPEIIAGGIAAGIPALGNPATMPGVNETAQTVTQNDPIQTPGQEQVPATGSSTLTSKFLEAIKKYAMQYGGALLRQKIEEYLLRKLTPQEELVLQDVERGRPITAGASDENELLRHVAPWLLGAVAIVLLLPNKPTRNTRVKRR